MDALRQSVEITTRKQMAKAEKRVERKPSNRIKLKVPGK